MHEIVKDAHLIALVQQHRHERRTYVASATGNKYAPHDLSPLFLDFVRKDHLPSVSGTLIKGGHHLKCLQAVTSIAQGLPALLDGLGKLLPFCVSGAVCPAQLDGLFLKRCVEVPQTQGHCLHTVRSPQAFNPDVAVLSEDL